VHGKKTFISVDETCDTEARYVANIIGTLEIDGPGEVFLRVLMSEVPESLNHSTICKLFHRLVFLLWPEGIQHDHALVFVTNVAPLF
jgi:hypothetical protein